VPSKSCAPQSRGAHAENIFRSRRSADASHIHHASRLKLEFRLKMFESNLSSIFVTSKSPPLIPDWDPYLILEMIADTVHPHAIKRLEDLADNRRDA